MHFYKKKKTDGLPPRKESCTHPTDTRHHSGSTIRYLRFAGTTPLSRRTAFAVAGPCLGRGTCTNEASTCDAGRRLVSTRSVMRWGQARPQRQPHPHPTRVLHSGGAAQQLRSARPNPPPLVNRLAWCTEAWPLRWLATMAPRVRGFRASAEIPASQHPEAGAAVPRRRHGPSAPRWRRGSGVRSSGATCSSHLWHTLGRNEVCAATTVAKFALGPVPSVGGMRVVRTTRCWSGGRR